MNIEEIYATDYLTGERLPLKDILLEMERRIDLLEEENVATTNNLLELAYEYDMLKTEYDPSWIPVSSRVDI